MRAADHGAWLGTTVFDGARFVEGIAARPDGPLRARRRLGPGPDADASANAAGDLRHRSGTGCAAYPKDARGLQSARCSGGSMAAIWASFPAEAPAGFCVCPRGSADAACGGAASRLTTTQFRRPVLADAVCNAKAGCLYPNNARHAGRGAPQGLRQRAGGRCAGQRGRNGLGQHLHGARRRRLHPDPERHFPCRHHAHPAHAQPARRRDGGGRNRPDLRGFPPRRRGVHDRQPQQGGRRSWNSTARTTRKAP